MNRFSDEQFKMLYDLIDLQYKDRNESKFLKTLVDYKSLVVGDKYYDFTAVDVKGKAVKFSDYFKGQYVLLDFSNVNCGYCYMAAPKTAKIAEELKDKLVYVTYHTGDKLSEAKEYYKLKGKRGNVIWNKEGYLHFAMAMYRNNSTPNYLIFSPEGKFLKEVSGTRVDLKNTLEELMK